MTALTVVVMDFVSFLSFDRVLWIFNENLKKIVGSTYARKNVSHGDGKFQRKTPKISTRTYSTCNVMRIVGTNGLNHVTSFNVCITPLHCFQ